MTDTTTIVVTEPQVAGVSWAAVIAGAVVSLALTLVLLTLGTGLGLAVVSPWANEGVSSGTFHIASGVFLLVVATMASALGGYVAGRLRSKWVGVASDEVYFRDTAHGFLAWAVASVIGAALLGSAAAGVVNSTTFGLAQGAAIGGSSSMSDPYVDRLLRPAANTNPQLAPSPTGAATADDTTELRAELSRIFATSFRTRAEVGTDDKTYIARVISQRTGLSQQDAERRVNEVVVQAKSAADEARKAAMKLALWMTAALFLGAFAASLAATEGGGCATEPGTGPATKQTRYEAKKRRNDMGRGILLWLIGVPIPIIILLALLR